MSDKRGAMSQGRFLVLFLLLAAPVLALDLNDPAVQARLVRGEIVVDLEREPGSHVLVGTAVAVIDAPRDHVWAVLGDYNHFSEFLPRFKECFMLKPDALEKIGDAKDLKSLEPKIKAEKQDSLVSDTLLLYHCLDFPFPVGDRRCIVKTVRDRVNFRTNYHLVRGDMKVNEGSWKLDPYGDKTLATYRTRSDPGLAVPGFLVSMGMRSVLPDVIEGVRRHVVEMFPPKG